jgi:hypothetical protein
VIIDSGHATERLGELDDAIHARHNLTGACAAQREGE